jgi:hypothetical protein
MIRKPVNKRASAHSFKRSVGRTNALNTRSAPQRGGWRL